jgi:hypothetical protein
MSANIPPEQGPAAADRATPADQQSADPNDLVVSVDGDSVLVYGTTRSDAEAIRQLKAAGFRWFRSLGAWGLPRSWRPETQLSRTHALVDAMAGLGRTVTVENCGPRLSAIERREARDERLAGRADRLEERAERNQAVSDSTQATADRIYGGFNGQPILADHHSAKRHRRDLDRADSALRTSIERAEVAADQQRRADQIRRHLERGDHPVTIKLRVLRNEAEVRRLQRSAARTGARSGDDVRRTAANRLAEEIELDRAVLDELIARKETRNWGPIDFQPGDLVLIHRLGWYLVHKVNKTTLTIPSALGPWTGTVPYAKVVARSRSGITQAAADFADESSTP